MLFFPFSCVLLFITATSVAFVFLCTCWTFCIITEPGSLNTLQFTSVWQKSVLDMFFCFVLKSTVLSISTLAFNTSCLYRKIHGLPTTGKPLGEVNVRTGLDRQSILLITHLQASGVVAKKLSIGQACSDAYSAAFGGLGHRLFLRQKGCLHRCWLWLVERVWRVLSLAHLLSSLSFFPLCSWCHYLLAFLLIPPVSMLTIKCGKTHKHLIALLTSSSLLILLHAKSCSFICPLYKV